VTVNVCALEVLAAAVVVPLKIALYVWLPIAGMILRVAFPPTNCAFPKMAVSSQKAAAALQKVTVPTDGAGLPVTDAVSVTSAGDATVDDESVSVVVVGSGAACDVVANVQASVSRAGTIKRRENVIRLQAEKDTFHIHTILGLHFTLSACMPLSHV
jgi:hypothetical protein